MNVVWLSRVLRERTYWGTSAITAALFIVCFGCGQQGLETAPVRGTVTLDGQPLDSGMVLFRPERGRMAVGEIQPDGTYGLSTYRKNSNDGAIVGQHKVTVIPPPPEGEFSAPPSMARPIPEKYQSEGTAMLSFAIEPGKDNVVNIELTSDHKP